MGVVMRKFFSSVKLALFGLFAFVGLMFSGISSAQAAGTGQGPDLSGMTDQINWGSTLTAIAAMAGALAGVYVLIKAAAFIIGMLKGNK